MTAESVSAQLQLLPNYLSHHLGLTLLALTIGVIICVPLGLLVTRVKWLQWPALTTASILQTIPGIALLALMVPLLGTIGFAPALLALILFSFLPILRNTVTGILGVDRAVVEAAHGLGMTDRQTLIRVEIPLALPTMVAGIRTATVWVVGAATLATPVGATSLGNYVFSGLQTQNVSAIVVGSLAAAVLSITLDQLIRLIEVAAVRRSKPLALTAAIALSILVGGGMYPAVSSWANDTEREPVVIGSKPFTEQYILAELIADHLSEAGFEPDIRSGMGTMLLFEALAGGSVDCYVDYSGTIWANVLKRSDTPTREEALKEITSWLRNEYGIVCLGPLGFENNYALAVQRKLADRYHLSTIEDLAVISSELTMGSDYEFFSRPEWNALKNGYGLQFRELVTMDPALMYSAVAEDEVDVISAFSTDGRIVAYDLATLADSKNTLPPYDAVLLLSPKAAERPKLVRELLSIIGSVDGESMRQTNKLVDLDGVSIDSAAQYLSGLMNKR